MKHWITTGLQKFGTNASPVYPHDVTLSTFAGYLVTRTALTGGGGLVQTFQRSYSMMDLSNDHTRNNVYRGRTGNIIEENDDETLVYSPHILKTYKSEEFLNSPNPSYASLKRLRSPDFVRSTESISSGYCSHQDLQEYQDIQQDNRRWEEHWRAVRESKQKLVREESHQDNRE